MKTGKQKSLAWKYGFVLQTLRKLACFDDEGGNNHLKICGSYAFFDSPWAVKYARETLAELGELPPVPKGDASPTVAEEKQ